MKKIKTAIAIGSWALAGLGAYVMYTAIRKPINESYQRGYEKAKQEEYDQRLQKMNDLERALNK